MRISDKERKVLAAVELNASEPLEQLAQNAGLSVHSTRYIVNKFLRYGLIRKSPFIDLYPLGFTDFVIFFTIVDVENRGYEHLIVELSGNPKVTFLAQVGGRYQYAIAFFSENNREFLEFLGDLNDLFTGFTLQKTVRMTRSFTRYNRTFLDSSIKKQSIVFGSTHTSAPIDELDDQILLALTEKPFHTISQIAQFIHAPLTTVHYRINQLKLRGIYVRDIYVIDTSKLGYTFYNLYIHSDGTEISKSSIKAWCDSHPNVVHLIDCIGSWDMEVGIEVIVPQEVPSIVQDLRNAVGNRIIEIELAPIFHNHKYLFYRPTKKSPV